MEWYDFMIYNYMLLFIAQAYFPSENKISSLLATMASSGVALIVRPLGGVLLSAWADRNGHHKALMLVFYLMALAIALITFTPTYAQIGIMATILLVSARLLQGLATGGEFGISSTLLSTLAPKDKKGFYTSWQMVGQLMALFLGSSMCYLLTILCSTQALYDYAWRIPFALGLLILPIGWSLRRQFQKQFVHHAAKKMSPAWPLIKKQKRNLAVGLGLVIGCTGSLYTLFSYMPVFGKLYLNLTMREAYLGPLIGISISILTIPFFGALSDKIGKKPIAIFSLSVFLVLIYPLLTILHQQPSLNTLMFIEFFFGICIGAYFGVLTAMLSGLFPNEIRSTCLAISYNSAVLLFGGFAPFVITALIERTKNPMVFMYYLMIAVSISLISALCYKEQNAPQYDVELDNLLTA